ncbi:MAG: hypothetical protein E4G95_05830 [Bacteroidia bacterium]|nr:MAG: hypothetical protein E4G95_05830 [Bacteroidia bacterium]
MNTISIIGSAIVTLALASYLVAIITEQVKKTITRRVIIFLTLGLSLDITATVCMIIGSPNSPFTIHGFVGYSALLIMIIETTLIWRLYRSVGFGVAVPSSLHIYSRIALIWWVAAYITGSMLAMVF